MEDLVKNLFKFSGITDDSRSVKKNFIFVAVAGLTVDGHDFIPQALKNGASVVVGEKDMQLAGVAYFRVQDSRFALGQLASKWYGDPSEKLKVIGVTGTKGKTTTCFILHHILTKLGKKAGLVTSVTAKIGAKNEGLGLHVTTPDVLALHKFLKDMVDAGCEYAVVEVSSHGIEQGRVAGVNFAIAALTNIAPEHLDYHKTLAAYKRVKMSFIKSAKKHVLGKADTDIDILPGKFNNLNADLALSVLELVGIPRDLSFKALKSFELPEGRLEEIKGDRNFRVFIDFAHTPESLTSALSYLKTLTKNKLIAVFGAAGKRDTTKRPRMGKAAADLAGIIILTAEDPRGEDLGKIAKEIRSGIDSPSVKVYEIPDRLKAIAFSLSLARQGDLIGIFGKGHERSMNLDGIHEIPWSDKKIVREYMDKH